MQLGDAGRINNGLFCMSTKPAPNTTCFQNKIGLL